MSWRASLSSMMVAPICSILRSEEQDRNDKVYGSLGRQGDGVEKRDGLGGRRDVKESKEEVVLCGTRMRGKENGKKHEGDDGLLGIR